MPVHRVSKINSTSASIDDVTDSVKCPRALDHRESLRGVRESVELRPVIPTSACSLDFEEVVIEDGPGADIPMLSIASRRLNEYIRWEW